MHLARQPQQTVGGWRQFWEIHFGRVIVAEKSSVQTVQLAGGSWSMGGYGAGGGVCLGFEVSIFLVEGPADDRVSSLYVGTTTLVFDMELEPNRSLSEEDGKTPPCRGPNPGISKLPYIEVDVLLLYPTSTEPEDMPYIVGSVS
jgi:hypothetical protein